MMHPRRPVHHFFRFLKIPQGRILLRKDNVLDSRVGFEQALGVDIAP